MCDWRESARRLTAGAWVSVDLDVLRSEREPELTLFVARDRGEIQPRAERSSVRKALAETPRRWRPPAGVAVGLARPFGLGVALTRWAEGGLNGLLWGGAVRVFALHHGTFCYQLA